MSSFSYFASSPETIDVAGEGIAKLPLIWAILYGKVDKYWHDSGYNSKYLQTHNQ